MSHSLSFLKGVIEGILHGTTIGVVQRDIRSLDYRDDVGFRKA